MGRDSMLERTVYLEPQPGEVFPVIKLKQGTTSLSLKLQISPRDVISDYVWKPAVVKATLPDGTEFFTTSACNVENRRISMRMYARDVRKMTSKAGRYKCTVTIINTEDTVTRENYMDYDILTVLPFTVIIEERGGMGC